MSTDGDSDNVDARSLATARLLRNYNDRFVKEEDYTTYIRLIQKATGASEDVINNALNFWKSPYSQRLKPTKRPRNTASPFTIAAGIDPVLGEKKSNMGWAFRQQLVSDLPITVHER